MRTSTVKNVLTFVGVVILAFGIGGFIYFYFVELHLSPDQVVAEWRSAQPFVLNTLAGDRIFWTLSADSTGALTMRVWGIGLSYRPKTITGSDGKIYTVPSDSIAIIPKVLLKKKRWTWREL